MIKIGTKELSKFLKQKLPRKTCNKDIRREIDVPRALEGIIKLGGTLSSERTISKGKRLK